MAQQNGDAVDNVGDADLAKAFQELARGERTASALENHLTTLERKIDELLAQANNDERNLRKDRSGADFKSHETVNGDKDAGHA